MNDEAWLVAICAGRWQIAGIRAAQKLGVKVLAVDGDPAAPGIQVADAGIVVDIRCPVDVVEALKAWGLPIGGATTFTAEAGMQAAGEVRAFFNLPGAGPAITGMLVEKSRQRAAWAAAGLPNPTWREVANPSDVLSAVHEVGLPCVLKPVDSSGSRGVSVIQGSTAGLTSAVDSAFAASRSGRVIVEAFATGVEHTVETFGDGRHQNVLCVTAKRKAGAPLTVATELMTLPRESGTAREVGALAASALDALGYHSGPGHVEVIRRPDGSCVLVEAGGRGGGFGVFEYVVPLATGFDIVAATAVSALGYATMPVRRAVEQSVVLRFVPSRRGRLAGVSIESPASHGVHVERLMEPGDVANSVSTDGDRVALILGHAETPEEALERTDEALAGIAVRWEEVAVGQPRDR